VLRVRAVRLEHCALPCGKGGSCRLLADEALRPLLREKHKGKLPYAKVAAYDVLLRFRHREIIRKMLQSIYRLDVYISVAKVAADRRFILRKPCRRAGIFSPGGRLPSPGKECRPNTLENNS